ncbi:MAG: ATP-binding protein, partial [Paraclostridium sp.]
SEGEYYLGLLRDEGLCRISPKDNSIKFYKNTKSNKNSISNNFIRYINEDEDGYIWIGTSYGLNKFDKKDETFTRYTTKDGLANNTIYGILLDEEDNIWVSSNQGISKIDKSNSEIKVKNLSVVDGLQGNEFNGNASFKSKSGELFFGGINGLNSFYPKDITTSKRKPEIVFDDFIVNGVYQDKNNLKKFNSEANTITIKFFNPNYSGRKNTVYEYKLEGASGDVAQTKDNYVTYNDLSQGKYIFKVKAIDSNGNCSDIKSIPFEIKPLIWFSKPAFIIYVLIVIVSIYNHKNKLKRLDKLVNKKTIRLREEMERNNILLNKNIKLERNKNSYFVNLSHELRTPLNIITSTNQLIEELIKKDVPIKKDSLKHYMDVSQRNCKRLLNLINNIIDSTKLQNDMYIINLKEVDIVYLVEETSLGLVDYVKTKGIDLIIDPEIEEKIILCDKHEIERCIVNLVGNAAKFTPKGGTITVKIKDLDDKVMITVEDTGIGIDDKHHKVIFDRFSQVVDRNNEVKGGSGLGLTITNYILKLHKGEIYVESKIGEGSKFSIILPVEPNIDMDEEYKVESNIDQI